MATMIQRVRKTAKHPTKAKKYIVIDNGIFSLHYGLTAFILVLFSILVLCHRPKEFLTCPQENNISRKFLNEFCQLRPISDRKYVLEQENGEYTVYNEKYSTKRAAGYFQTTDAWLSLLFLFQALLFIVPRYFWKFMESGRVEILVTLLNNIESTRQENLKQLTDILFASARKNKKYLMSFFAAELINALNVTTCIIILAIFFDKISVSAVDVIEFADTDWSLCWESYCNLDHYLPKLTQCTIHRCMASGNVSSHKAAMVLPTFIIYQKMHTFLSYWFYMVACLSYLVLCYRVFLVISPPLRVKVLKMRCENVNPSDLVLIIRALGLGNWFLINLLSKNMDPETFSDSTAILAKKIRNEISSAVPGSDVLV